jgi:hypothetical protein
VEVAIEEAKKACDDGSTGECAAAWDSVCYDLYNDPVAAVIKEA